MKIYFLLFVAIIIMGIAMIISGIVYRKDFPPVLASYLIIIGIIAVIMSVFMCLCLGFFMR